MQASHLLFIMIIRKMKISCVVWRKVLVDRLLVHFAVSKLIFDYKNIQANFHFRQAQRENTTIYYALDMISRLFTFLWTMWWSIGQ